ncbi:hypothetical protein MYX78_04985 [Acidobacteria bacterium AH-259-G07]|nr:hypothetical protein [Acidobacteria bacterium AH-259-G07]
MPLYLCRWPNGDFSFVSAANKEAAVEPLDEVANAEGCPLHAVREFMVHFHLADDGAFEFEGFGEVTQDAIWETYPILDETLDLICEHEPAFELQGPQTPKQQMMISEAVSKERTRIEPKKVRQPKTQLGREIKKAMDAPTSIIDREIGKGATERLRRLKLKGKPN